MDGTPTASYPGPAGWASARENLPHRPGVGNLGMRSMVQAIKRSRVDKAHWLLELAISSHFGRASPQDWGAEALLGEEAAAKAGCDLRAGLLERFKSRVAYSLRADGFTYIAWEAKASQGKPPTVNPGDRCART